MRELQKLTNSVLGLTAVPTESAGEGKLKAKVTADATVDHVITPQNDLSFVRELLEVVLKEGVTDAMDRKNKVCEWKSPEELRALLTDLEVKPEAATKDQLMAMVHDIIKYSVKTAHPRFFNQLYGGMDQLSLAGCLLTEALNGSQYTYEVAPVFTIMEKEIYQKMLGCIGFDGGDAIFCPGGSIANLYAVNLARFMKFPEVKTKGIFSLTKPPCLFTSEKCHYSIGKAAATLGLGTDNVFQVKTDENGRIIPADLEEQVIRAKAEGYEPFFVNATAGTTVMGAYDPINPIADICEEYNLWLHVDGAWGGGAILSKKYKHLLEGVQRADSMTWNPHKLMGAPQQCSVFLTKHSGRLQECHSANAAYLFQQDKHYDTSYDTGDMSLQCGRKVDVLKLWMQWKGKGENGMERDIDHLFDLSRYLASKVKQTKGFRLLLEPQCTNVCFYYVPPSLRGQEETPEWWDKLSKVPPVVKERMVKCGSMMIGYQPDGIHSNFFRMIFSNFDTSYEDVDFIISEIERLSNDL